MNEKVFKIITFATGIIAAFVGLFFFVQSIITATSIDSNMESKLIIYSIIIAVLELALAALLIIVAAFIIKGFVQNDDKCALHKYLALLFFSFEALLFFIAIVFGAYKSAYNWVSVIFASAGVAAVIVYMFVKLEDIVKIIMMLSLSAWGFVFSILRLSSTGPGRVWAAAYAFSMFMFASLAAYYICKLIDKSSNKSIEE